MLHISFTGDVSASNLRSAYRGSTARARRSWGPWRSKPADPVPPAKLDRIFTPRARRALHDQDDLKLLADLNDQLRVISDEKGTCMEKLAESISSLNVDAGERSGKDEQEHELRHEFVERIKLCKA